MTVLASGWTVPIMAGRIDSSCGNSPKLHEFAPLGITGELRRLDYDTANSIRAPMMAARLKLVPASQVTYGTDDPYFRLDQMRDLERLGLDVSDLTAVGSANAVRLIPRLGV
ncbi:hypothetical protein [Bradyrhizobium sp.]|uniref:hypothetical protein n=1 Tax=Bradyrhizobium sp. TaxID=376 RepID=UPI003C5A387D